MQRRAAACVAIAVWTTLVAPLAADEPDRHDAGARLIDHVSARRGYARVRREVLRWHGTTSNACVAFVTTALRQIGIDIPQDGERDGYGISRITFALSAHLEEDRGWRRIVLPADLRRGDLVFTTGHPDHVFVFAGWNSRRRHIAWAIDNQGFTHARPLFPRTGDDTAGFAYALRATTR